MAILYPTSLASLLVEMGTRHYHQGSFSISLLELSQLKGKSLSQVSNLLQTGYLSCVQASDLGEILTWDTT